jgi:hypothetical protein
MSHHQKTRGTTVVRLSGEVIQSDYGVVASGYHTGTVPEPLQLRLGQAVDRFTQVGAYVLHEANRICSLASYSR